MTGRKGLFTEEDVPIEVVYPGRPNDDHGADLRDAVIAAGGVLQRGDIEVHVRSSSWRRHRHHQDPLYNRVILQVVYRHDAAAATLQNGHEVPTLALERFISPAGRGGPLTRQPLPCLRPADKRNLVFIGSALDAAGNRRFEGRAAEFRAAMKIAGPPQVLYEGIMGALGYVKNKVPMLELARHLPLSRLVGAATGAIPDEECLVFYQALLLGTAGLLPSQESRYWKHGWVDRLEECWASRGERMAMSADDWHSFKVRPGSLPRRRLAAMSYLLGRYRCEGLLPALFDELSGGAPESGHRRLRGRLLVGAEDFWGNYIDFGLPARRTVPALLGEDRADIIVVNVLLPFAAAWEKSAALAAKAADIYRRYPALAENGLEKHMRRQLGISRFLVNSARRQQGLIHIFKTLCAQGECGVCPLS
jgi:hypothetical protein